MLVAPRSVKSGRIEYAIVACSAIPWTRPRAPENGYEAGCWCNDRTSPPCIMVRRARRWQGRLKCASIVQWRMYSNVTGDAASQRRKVYIGLLCDKRNSCALLARVVTCLYPFATASFLANESPRDTMVPVRPVEEVIDRIIALMVLLTRQEKIGTHPARSNSAHTEKRGIHVPKACAAWASFGQLRRTMNRTETNPVVA
jgi:hypothetical protein